MFIEKGYQKKLVCKELQIKRSVVYYLQKENKPGRKASTVTMYKSELVTEQTVLTNVKSILDHEFLSYGYFKISKQLKIDGFVINKKKGKSTFAIFADIGPKTKLGEGSIALAAALEVKKNPKTGGPVVDLIYIVFPGSGNGKPRSLDEINGNGQASFAEFGGMEQVNACFGQ